MKSLFENNGGLDYSQKRLADLMVLNAPTAFVCASMPSTPSAPTLLSSTPGVATLIQAAHSPVPHLTPGHSPGAVNSVNSGSFTPPISPSTPSPPPIRSSQSAAALLTTSTNGMNTTAIPVTPPCSSSATPPIAPSRMATPTISSVISNSSTTKVLTPFTYFTNSGSSNEYENAIKLFSNCLSDFKAGNESSAYSHYGMSKVIFYYQIINNKDKIIKQLWQGICTLMSNDGKEAELLFDAAHKAFLKRFFF